MKKIFLLWALFLLSCGWWEGEDINLDGLTSYNMPTFSISVPEKWQEMEAKNLPKPKDSQIELAVASSDFKYWFSNNILILSQKLENIVSSSDFTINNYIGGMKEYSEFQKIESREFEFYDGRKTQIYIFEAKYNPQTPILKYIQLGSVCDTRGYLITLALSQDVKDTSLYEKFLQTFECK